MARNRKKQPVNLKESMYAVVNDPLGFVNFAYDWNKGVLAGEKGPDEWQEQALEEIGRGDKEPKALLYSIKSGHEVGKTTLAAWIIHWFISTRPHPQIVATANTQAQLGTKLWRELAKWWNVSVHKEWFTWTATKFYHNAFPETWFAAAIPWSKDNADAFQGTHEKRVLIVYDESAAIDDVIWEATEGSMPVNGIWLVTGNPTKTTGRFRECWGRFKHRWMNRTVDARTAKHSNKQRIQDWIEDYGEDSDFVRIRVTGEFPRSSIGQFISDELVSEARQRKLIIDSFKYAPVVFGIDLARFGDDQSVIFIRQGLKTHEIRRFREKDEMQMVGHILEANTEYKPQTIFIESGFGTGVIDRLRQLGHKHIIEVVHKNYGINDNKIYSNVRTHMWGNMKEWLKTGSIPPGEQELADDLTGPEYGFDKYNRFQLEKKEDMKGRGLASPDSGDALSFSFYLPVPSNTDIQMQEQLIRARQPQGFIPLNPSGGY